MRNVSFIVCVVLRAVYCLSVCVIWCDVVCIFPLQKVENTAVGMRHADHVAPTIRKSWH
jgi:hypothetical protein